MSYRTVLCTSLFIMFVWMLQHKLFSSGYDTTLVYGRPYEIPTVMCRRNSWICGSAKDLHSIDFFFYYHCLVFSVTVPFSITLLITFFCNFEWTVFDTLFCHVEEGPNNCSSCCTFKKKRWGWMYTWWNSEICHLMCQKFVLFFCFLISFTSHSPYLMNWTDLIKL